MSGVFFSSTLEIELELKLEMVLRALALRWESV